MKIPKRKDVKVRKSKKVAGFFIKENIGISVINTDAIHLESPNNIDWKKVNWDIGR